MAKKRRGEPSNRQMSSSSSSRQGSLTNELSLKLKYHEILGKIRILTKSCSIILSYQIPGSRSAAEKLKLLDKILLKYHIEIDKLEAFEVIHPTFKKSEDEASEKKSVIKAFVSKSVDLDYHIRNTFI